jgi:hypothetical protein
MMGTLCTGQSCESSKCCNAFKIHFTRMMGSVCRGVLFVVYMEHVNVNVNVNVN